MRTPPPAGQGPAGGTVGAGRGRVPVRGNLVGGSGNSPFVGHITLSIADIEFVSSDEILLDDDDVVVLSEPSALRRRAVARHTLSRSPGPARATSRRSDVATPSFDDMQTAVRAVPRFARVR
jgi:hypothetical protein